MISRSFLIDQWLDILPVGRSSTPLSILFSAVTFSPVHYYERAAGIVSNFVIGILLGAL